MTYVVSDIHGRIDLFEKLLRAIDFSKDDIIYVLGDCIDRGGGLFALERIMELQENGQAQLIQGNHEVNFAYNISKYDSSLASKLYCNDYFFEAKKRKGKVSFLDEYRYMAEKQKRYERFCESVNAAVNLTLYESYMSSNEFLNCYDSKQREKVIRFIASAPTHTDIEVNSRKFRLLHAGCNAEGMTRLDIRDEFFNNPNPLEGVTIVFGHTTTKDIRMRTECIYTQPSIWYDEKNNNDKIGIDCGCCFSGGKLACLRLDDLKEFYVDNENLTTFSIESLNDYFNGHGYSLSKFKDDIWSL